jgi:hypothetical protein
VDRDSTPKRGEVSQTARTVQGNATGQREMMRQGMIEEQPEVHEILGRRCIRVAVWVYHYPDKVKLVQCGFFSTFDCLL